MVYIILGNGFEEMEAVTPFDLLSRAGIPVCYAGIDGRHIVGAHGIVIEAGLEVENIDPEEGEMIVLPGGRGGVESIMASPVTLEKVKKIWMLGGFAAAICAAPVILAGLGITHGKQVTCYPHECWTNQMQKATMVPGVAAIRDDRVITGTSAGCAIDFSLELVSALRGKEAAEKVRQGIVIR